jgi:hypothetical protein
MEEHRDAISSKIEEFEEELSTTKYNKRTQHHVGLVKAKIARLREEQEKRAGKSGAKIGFAVKKTGDASVAILGFPSVGKSTLINKLTNVESKVGSYDFTTLDCIPGMMFYNNARIQLLDMPGIIEGASQSKGRGREALSLIRNCDLILILIDKITQLAIIKNELRNANFRINSRKPDVIIKPTGKGGIRVLSTVKLTRIDKKTIEEILKEYRITNAEVVIRENIDIDGFVDVLAKNICYVAAIVAFNKIDLLNRAEIENIKKNIPGAILISADANLNLEELREKIFQKLKLIRIYLKKISKEADMNEPVIMKDGSTIKNVCEKLHREFLNKFKYARVWGESAKFPGQVHQLSHALKDKDIVEIHLS